MNWTRLLSLPKSCPRFFGVFPLSTQTLTDAASQSTDSLYKRVSTLGDPRVSIVPVLEKWVEEGRKVQNWDLRSMVKQLRNHRRFKHALEISQWMADQRRVGLSGGDIAVRLDLICKVHGLEHAEKYFNEIPQESKNLKTYGALLNCYAQEKYIEKAETLFEKMKELGLDKPLAYNALMKVYYLSGQHEKLDMLMQGMEQKGIPQDKYAFCIRMSAYTAISDIDGMENILKKMEKDPKIIMDWDVYSLAAVGYTKVGSVDKALAMLKKLEGLITVKKRVAYDFLLTLYAGLGQKDEIYRIWDLYKSLPEKLNNASYLNMINSLLKLDDIEGAEKIVDDWDSGCTVYDFRVPNRLILAYCKNGLLTKAESFVNKALERGKTPNVITWYCLAMAYMEDKQISKAAESMKKAMLVAYPGWRLNPDFPAKCLEHFVGQGDVEGAEEFVRLLRPLVPLTRDVYHRLLRTYITAGKPVSCVLNQMKTDGLEPDKETQEILEPLDTVI
ncbi:pentatricopeptide repeat-containing protein At2g20710, mitochondrial-like [Tasmannia lanceolata]|uniref:pentatricopeptide repeat-containing protein At2g20710, mitochondrial-like n=1 Tax=Tasmannia lanceolata TaxID=3420 RepID=UPI004064BC4D